MSNYFAQIAARNAVSDQPSLMPSHSPGEPVLDDPRQNESFGLAFDSSTLPGQEAGTDVDAIRPATNIHSAGSKEATSPVQRVKENATEVRAQVEVKPVYLSKYVERNHYHTRVHSQKDISVSQTSKQSIPLVVEQQASPVLPERQELPSKKEAVHPVTSMEKISPAANQEWPDKETAPMLNSVLPKSVEQKQAQPAILLPVAADKEIIREPVLLMPNLPLQPQQQSQKEKPVPSLVIGKITVEIVPAQKPANKIINHVIKSQPAASTAAQRSKNSFGLGQL